MKRYFILTIFIVIIFILLMFFNKLFYKELENENIITPGGDEYVYLAGSGLVESFGEKTFCGWVKGDPFWFNHLHEKVFTGIFSVENDPEQRILIRMRPQHHSTAYYRKASLPELDLSPDNYRKIEYISYSDTQNGFNPDIFHMTCNEGLIEPMEIQDFIKDIQNQKTVEEAGYMTEWSRNIGYIYGFFVNEPNLAIKFYVWELKNKKYSIEFRTHVWNIGTKRYVIPEKWVDALKIKSSY